MTEPVLHTWYGQPLNEIPRKVLEQEFVKLYKRFEESQRQLLESQVRGVRDLVSFKRQLMIARQPWYVKFANRITR